MNIASYIEHTILNPLTTSNEIDKLIGEAKEYNFVGVCVPPYWVEKTRRDLRGTDIKTVTVIGFPLGYQRTQSKRQEMETAIKDGADELDMVMTLSAFANGSYDWVKIEIAQLAKLAHEREKILKVILETAYWNDEQIKFACQLCVEAGADFVKTSTGFAKEGAKVEHIQLMRSICPSSVGVKASGGIRSYESAISMIQAGADRIGTSASVAIVTQTL
ncbi:MAG: deoxyribose-phosphate aldolase [Raineya sp.]|jgi:deoxyribose-phosphate aldolase|nr:deoxyribose-phosphate aldolase [Raineya sp.]